MSGSAVDEQSFSPAAACFLDALRFIAVNLILAAHVLVLFFDDPLADKILGAAVVALFVLSGFLIARSLMSRANRPGPRMPAFLAARVARIMTPLLPVLLIVALLNATLIRTGWSLDGLGALSSQFAIYIAAGLLVFGVLLRERIRVGYVGLLALVSAPIVIWNVADSAGKALSLVWIIGSLAGVLAAHIRADGRMARSKAVSASVLLFGALALAALIAKNGFDPFDLQTVFLMTVVFLGVILRLNQSAAAWKAPAALAKFFASYSYSLFLVHNTVLALIFQHSGGLATATSIVLAVALAHAAALLIHHGFERHHRAVGRYLEPVFRRALMQSQPQLDAEPVDAKKWAA